MTPLHKWRFLHFFLYVVITISSMAAMIPSYGVKDKFGASCPLYANPEVALIKEEENELNSLLRLFESNHSIPDLYQFTKDTKWASMSMCFFTQFTPTASFMFSVIWAWFFCVCSSDGNKLASAGITKPWRLVPPATFFTIVMTIVILVAAVVMTQGMQHFCNRLEQSPVGGCWNAEQVVWTHYPHLQGFYGQHLRAVAALWVCTSAWCVATIVLLIRCCCTNVDFATNHGGMTPMDQIRRRASYEHLQQEEQA